MIKITLFDPILLVNFLRNHDSRFPIANAPPACARDPTAAKSAKLSLMKGGFSRRRTYDVAGSISAFHCFRPGRLEFGVSALFTSKSQNL